MQMNWCHCRPHITLSLRPSACRIPPPRPRETLKGTLHNHNSLSLVGYSRITFKTRLIFLLWYESESPTSGVIKMCPLDQIRLALLKTILKEKAQAARRTEAIPWVPSALEAALSLQCRYGFIDFCGPEINTWEDYWCFTARVQMEQRTERPPMPLPPQKINKARSTGRGSVLNQLIHHKNQK